VIPQIFLPDDVVEVEPVGWHSGAGARGSIALGVCIGCTVCIARVFESAAHKNLCPLRQPPALPILISVSEQRPGSIEPHDIPTYSLDNVMFNHAEHHHGFIHLDRAFFKTKSLSELVEGKSMNARNDCSAQIYGDFVRLLMVQGSRYPLS